MKWLDKYEKVEGEESPIAITLCATKSDMVAELLELDNSGIHVAQYLTEMSRDFTFIGNQYYLLVGKKDL